MLFDLRGSGRRTTVKVVYVTLAILMGGGLVLFGIGGSVSGGLIDAITQSDSTSSTGDEEYQKRADSAQRKAEATPQDAAAWAEAARANYTLALSGGNYDQNTGQFTASGKRMKLRQQDVRSKNTGTLFPSSESKSACGKSIQPSSGNDEIKSAVAFDDEWKP